MGRGTVARSQPGQTGRRQCAACLLASAARIILRVCDEKRRHSRERRTLSHRYPALKIVLPYNRWRAVHASIAPRFLLRRAGDQREAGRGAQRECGLDLEQKGLDDLAVLAPSPPRRHGPAGSEQVALPNSQAHERPRGLVLPLRGGQLQPKRRLRLPRLSRLRLSCLPSWLGDPAPTPPPPPPIPPLQTLRETPPHRATPSHRAQPRSWPSRVRVGP